MSDVYAGSICGTSLDGIDVALVEFESSTRLRVIDYLSMPLPAKLADTMRAIVFDGAPCDVLIFGQLDQQFGIAIAEALLALIERSDYSASQIAAFGSHGINLLHAPDEPTPVSIQIGDPNQIARLTGITTVADFRRRDVALGGQGAPLAPAFHSAVFSDARQSRVVLNLGGIANITVLEPDREVIGFDTGPANGLLDAWYVLHHPKADRPDATRFDLDGAWASGGRVLDDLLEALASDPYFDRPPPKSTGKEHFNLAWVQGHLNAHGTPDARDVQATLSELTARTVAERTLALCPTVSSVLVCGGGAHNTDLIKRLQNRMGDASVMSTEVYGVAPDHVEAAAFAWLARQTLARKPGNLASVTGASDRSVLGGIYYP